ncbi:MAG: type IX secretion system sortase PorU, partial [Ignavibacteriaceae bacterium]|nr:type IX secretion system sortase PorU [Ignavibacteriaceae bacterium]
SGVVEYPLKGFSSSDINVFDVTDYASVKKITNPIVWSGAEFKFRSAELSKNISKYVGVTQSAFLTPANPMLMQNSNIHGLQPGAKFIIIANKTFKTQAEQFKQYKETEIPIPITTQVVYQDEIFNEFSGGVDDPVAIRNFIRYAYENWQIQPEYVLLFGDGSYDYKNIEGGNQGKNFIITFQTIESLHEVYSSIYDDFYVRISGNDSSPDLAIGRLPIQNSADASVIISKIKEYETGINSGDWRNKITFIADDAITSDGWEGAIHSGPSETVANALPGSYDVRKIYLSNYPRILTSAGVRIPTANVDIINAMNSGNVIVNYVGHGNPRVWAHEIVFDKDVSIPQLHSTDYFFLTAATCDFGDFDKPSLQSGAEELFLKENGGSIGAFTAARLVFAQQNTSLMAALFDNLFGMPRDTLNYLSPIGKIILRTKNRSGIDVQNDQKYHLLTDPTLRLNVPHFSSSVDSINGVKIDSLTNIKALSKVSIKGHVVNPDGSPWNNFNGEGILSVYDSQRQFTLMQGTTNLHQVTMQGGQIFKGRVSITNGEWDASFVVPKDISYENKTGKIVFYFTGENTDGTGFTNKFTVGGTDSGAVNDKAGPEIEIYFDDITSTAAYLANPNSTLIVKLFDESGLNTTGTGIGHKLEGILNEDSNNAIDFSNYFIGDVNVGGKSGKVEYKFNGLDLGDYKMDVKAWDVFNNFTTETAYFNIVSGDELVIRDVYNYPNPFKSNTSFTFQQNLNRAIDVKIKVYTVAGRLIKNIERTGLNDKFVNIDWDGRDEDGNVLANGAYLYKLIVKTTDGQYSQSVLGKLAVIR